TGRCASRRIPPGESFRYSPPGPAGKSSPSRTDAPRRPRPSIREVIPTTRPFSRRLRTITRESGGLPAAQGKTDAPVGGLLAAQGKIASDLDFPLAPQGKAQPPAGPPSATRLPQPRMPPAPSDVNSRRGKRRQAPSPVIEFFG